MTDFHRDDSNCPSQSEVIVAGTPNWETHIKMKVLATVSIVPSVIGTASGH